MGIYVNSKNAYTLYKSETAKPYFIDKTMILKELFPLVEEGNNYLCITRPRRFGKTVMANMIAAFFSKGKDAEDIFETLQIHPEQGYPIHLNQHSVIHITFNDLPRKCTSYEQYIDRIEEILRNDLRKLYPEILMEDHLALWDILLEIYAEMQEEKFIFVLDEWDFILHQRFITQEDKTSYLLFLRNLLKDRPYISQLNI